MYPDPDSRENAFQIFARVKRVPFAISRHTWEDRDLIVILKVVPKRKYGVAYGFPVRGGVPNDHLAYDSKWKKQMELPNVGSYQWRYIDVPDSRLKELEEEFYRVVAPKFGFVRQVDSETQTQNELPEI